MPFTSSSLVLVTGANGHVAQHIVAQLLQLSGEPKVRATVRSSSSGRPLEETFPLQIQSGRLEIVYISDITDSSAFDSHLKGVTHIAHVASPVEFDIKNVVDDLLKPAINGTTSVLEAASRTGSVEAIVVTGSFAAVFDTKKGYRSGSTYCSDDWNPMTYEQVADPNLDLTEYPEQYRSYVTYMASKKLAEKAAWDFHEANKPNWRLNFVLPTWIGGPNVLPLYRGIDGFSVSQKLVWRCATEDRLPGPDFPFWIDVRDVAAAHVACLEKDTVDKQRFLMGEKPGWYSGVSQRR
jgi:NADPH-dependent methylglyoxal reductase